MKKAKRYDRGPKRPYYKGLVLIPFIVLACIATPIMAAETAMDTDALRTTCQNGTDDKAINACTRIIDSHLTEENDVVDALIHRTEIFYQSLQFDKALLGTEKLIELRPQMPAIYSRRANIFELQNKIKEAAEAHAQAADLSKDKERKTDSLAFSGILYHAAGEKKLAQQKINLALQIDPEAIQAFDMRHHIAIKEGKLSDALEALNKKLEEHPFDTGWLQARATTKMLQHDYNGAIKDIEEAISLDQRDPYQVLWLYLIKRKQGNTKLNDLKTQSERFGEVTWPIPIFKYLFGEISEEQLRQAASKEVGYPGKIQLCEALFQIAENNMTQNQKEKAISLFKEAVMTCPPGHLESSTSVRELQNLEHEGANR